MEPEILLAGATLAAVIAYAVLAGADFGGGVWDLFASGPRKDQQREVIARAMGPVWEANHVWLIFVIVMLFSGFPKAFAVLSIALFTPFRLVLIGIILRGAAFVFRAYSPESARDTRLGLLTQRWGVIFGVASVITPVLLGMTLSAVSAGELRVSDAIIQPTSTPWITPLALAMGALALALCAYLAAVYLTLETRAELQEDFRRRALFAGTAVVALSLLTLPLLYFQAAHLWNGLISLRAAPLVAGGIIAALISGWTLLQRRFRLARIATVVQVTCLLAGWGVAQYPHLIYPDLTLAEAASPDQVLWFLLGSLPFGIVLLVPSLWFLFKVFKSEVEPS